MTFRIHLAALAAAATALLAAGSATAATAVSHDVSSNWAGYVVTGASFTSVTGTWVQPTADCSSTGTGASAFWVGLGGSTGVSGSLEQAGTSADCDAAGNATYRAWYELVPAPSVTVALKVLPGDTITTTVTVAGSRVTMQVRNVTRNTVVTKIKLMAAPDTTSAEWVAEAPSLCASNGACQTLSLADFGSVKFTNASATADGHTGSISDRAWTATAIDLVADNRGPSFGRYAAELSTTADAVTTALTSRGTAFRVKWQGSVATGAPPPPPSWP